MEIALNLIEKNIYIYIYIDECMSLFYKKTTLYIFSQVDQITLPATSHNFASITLLCR